MNSLKKNAVFVTFCFSLLAMNAQYEMKPVEGYSPQIGLMVYMLEDLKSRITAEVKDLDQAQTDFVFDKDANSIGSLLMHLVSTEAYFQIETLEERQWSDEEKARFGIGAGLNEESKEKLKGKPIQHYLDLWEEVREKTLAGLKTKDDAWFASNVDEDMNYHWAWYHVMEHSANHMGQIALVKNRLDK
ncbi:DinB family protein [Aggregatimonas sangjinii]|uniref:DinB family protein n=1 Tax=Aggregatimonas sangjinii TaxID=2583587 RepID=A0A5B7SW58_9FLAO|nr:DinB family protein [Aggregatimonas sangjinii]QCX01000.1 DinB family protein [Aggregatimonas sangjinii]